ncbi:MAG: hypothetical protein ACREHE_03225 [Rhizomicrobium sp.]
MLKLAAALLLVTQLGNAAPAPNPNLDASPPPAAPQPQITQPGPATDMQFQHGAVDPRGTDAQPLAVRVVSMPAPPPAAETSQPSPAPPAGPDWFGDALGVIELLLLGALVFFVKQGADALRHAAMALERGDTAP